MATKTSKRTYKAVLFAPDGDWTIDYHRSVCVEHVQDQLADQGSKWFFYPFHAVIVDHGALTDKSARIVDAAAPFEHMKGSTIGKFSEMLKSMPEDDLRMILEG